MNAGRQRTGRIFALDLGRSLALVAMAVFHFTFDLELFGLITQGTIGSWPWRTFAKCIAGSFLFLSGVSLWLAQGGGIRRGPYLRRLAMIAGAAALITLATWLAVPEQFIFFGILHCIAFASVAGLAFLRVPAGVILLVALGVWIAPAYIGATASAPFGLQWLGLGARTVVTLDYVPVFPWFGPFLAGLAAAKIAARAGLFEALRSEAPEGRLARLAGWPGRHSLAVYLLHQPVLVSLVWLFVQGRALFGG